jgi:uncharacterized protein (TIGR00369 family)
MNLDPNVEAAIRQFMEHAIPFNQLVGLRVAHLDVGFARLEIPFQDALIGDPLRPAIHGGVLSTLIDTCGGAAVFTHFDDLGDRTSTVDLRVDYLRPGGKETLVAEANVVRIGNRVAVVDVVFHEGGRDEPLATGKAVYNVRRARDARGSE